MKKKALVRVLGCKVNQAEAAALVSALAGAGYESDENSGAPDLVLAHTCCVTAKAEGKSRRMVKRLAETYPDAAVVVTGCLAEINPTSLQAAAPRALILGAFEKDRIAEHLLRPIIPGVHCLGSDKCRQFADHGAHEMAGRSRAFLKIQDGCSQRCSYCVVPDARGPSRSLAPDKVLEYARRSESGALREIVLTGVHIGRYGGDLDPPTSLESLLARLLAAGAARYRISSLEPQEITPGIVRLIGSHTRLCPHLHIPLQSGDNEVLRRMGRPYSTELVADLVKDLRTATPEICLGFDVIVGFPGEDEASFERTYAFIEKVAPAYLHVFPFSPRPNAPAAAMRPRPAFHVVRERAARLRDLGERLRSGYYARFVGRTLSAIAESESADGRLTVRTGEYIPVQCPTRPGAHYEGELHVKILRVEGDQTHGEIVSSAKE
jgi:threonylcarbamoyladenosine tRNA methylthiotransferase MtaB